MCITVFILRGRGDVLTHAGTPTENGNEKQTVFGWGWSGGEEGGRGL